MIKIIAGGKKSVSWCQEACCEYEKRLRKPYEISWQFMDEDKFLRHLEKWPFGANEFVICCDERGENISSPEFSKKLGTVFMDGRDVVVLIGGAYGFTQQIRDQANFVWSFSRLVFPHMISRLIVTEQIYRAAQIAAGGPYHHV